MKQYRNLVEYVINSPSPPRETRTGIPVKAEFGPHMVFDMYDGTLPMVTLKHLPFKSVLGELCGFIQGADSAATFRAFGSKVWDANANDPGLSTAPNQWLSNPFRRGEDHTGRIYGVQWRAWNAMVRTAGDLQAKLMAARGWKGRRVDSTPQGDILEWTGQIDQLAELVQRLKTDPFSRYHVVSAWNPGELQQMALPPCHILFQCFVEERNGERYLHLGMYQRSADIFLGVPFNITSYAILTHLLAHLVGIKPGRLHMQLGDAHLYMNHYNEARQMLSRASLADSGESMPMLRIDGSVLTLDDVVPEAFTLTGYKGHGAIKAPMAV